MSHKYIGRSVGYSMEYLFGILVIIQLFHENVVVPWLTLFDCVLVLGGNHEVDSVESLPLTVYQKHE